MRKAFILGAGLGTRLRPLTETLPKPLVPYQNRPLVTHLLDRCLAAGITDVAINTHHLPEAWDVAFPDKSYRDMNFSFFHEPDLLETGGGIKNIASWIGSDPVLVHNGDIVTDLPLERLITGHYSSNNVATLAVQDHGPQPHLALDGHQITDIHGKVASLPGTHQFTGIYVIDPEILDLIPAGEKISVIPAFLELIKQQRLGAYHVKGDPDWLDLGTRETYLEAHQTLENHLHREAKIDSTANVANSWIGEKATVEAGATLQNCVVWPGAHITGDAELTNCIVHTTSPISGSHHHADL